MSKQKVHNLPKLMMTMIIIFLLGTLFGGIGYYLTKQNGLIEKQKEVQQINQEQFEAKDEENSWKTYKDEELGFEFQYDNRLDVSGDGIITVKHSVPFEHENPCDFGQESALPVLSELVDFNIDIEIKNFSIMDAIRDEEGEYILQYMDDNQLKPAEGFIDEIKIAQFGGYRINHAFEGCGSNAYYFPAGSEKTLFVQRYDITELIFNPERYSNIERIIMPQEADIIFNQIISSFKVIEKDDFFSCGDDIKDIDNNIYKTVQIGEQCWMKENLKVTKNPEGEKIIRYCLNDNASSCNNDGGLYNWNTAMDGLIKEGSQGICPDGWHIPEDLEWFVLENYLKDERQACSQNRTGWGCDSAGTKIRINGSSGFDAPFAGYRDIDKYGTIHSWGRYAGFWSSSIYRDKTWYRFIRSDESRILRIAANREYGRSIRCLKD